MMKSLDFSEQDIDILENIFLDTINLASQIYEDKLFKPFDVKSDKWTNRAYKEYYDAVMVGFSRHLNDTDLLLEKKRRVIEETKTLLSNDKKRIFTGSGKSKTDLQNRIKFFDNMLSQIIAE